ncbi:hypothetical protein K6119_11080 [Paracrocinitomix mangrovi]|uniref:hypothetical protein n=1 Tax=Paracrocinitomix mangrovi TaxID=2862509 RepID=UPI001C8EE4AA|nr:hypothetical protein [Paracrocinitomix mangrovi]UKN00277.1 hypothetical protein K6119_11080 [Paracrocinitomix mangrovi]
MDQYFQIASSYQLSQEIERRYADASISVELKSLITSLMRDPKLFDAEQFNGFELREIFDYLNYSHQYYLEVSLPKIENTLHQLYQHLGNDYWSVKLLSLFISAYKIELKEHIEDEELVLFSFVKRLLNNQANDEQQTMIVQHFINNHDDNIIIKLVELKEDLLSINAELKDQLIVEILFNQLSIFQRDLLVHGLIEDHVFVPRILKFCS